MKNYKAKNVDEYIASAPKEAQPKLREIRVLVKSTISKAEETISYGVPFYKYFGLIAGFAAHKNHVGIWFPTAPLESKDRQILEEKGYITKEKTIQIKFDQELPSDLIKQILKALAKSNEAKER